MSGTPRGILIVEDNELNRDMLGRRLERKGYRVTVAHDGEAGLAAAASDCPDLILMDVDLPGIDGWETCRRLKAAAATGAIPVIALTAHASPGARGRSVEAGCDDYETKPIEFPRLLAKVEALLARVPERSRSPGGEGVGGDGANEEVGGGAPALDVAVFRTLAEDCGWSTEELSEQLLQQGAAALEGIHAAVECGDADGVARAAHGAVGSTGACGATRLMDLLRGIENTARASGLDGTADPLREARAEFERVRAELAALE